MFELIKTDVDQTILNMKIFSFGIEQTEVELYKKLNQQDAEEGFCETYVVKDDGKSISSIKLIDFDMKLRNSIVKMCGVAGVVTSAVHRGKGGGRFMLTESLKLMREKDYAMSALYPFNIDFYRKYGWERFDDMLVYTLSPSLFVKNDTLKDYDIEEIFCMDSQTLDFYNYFASNHYNLIQKSEYIMNRELFSGFPNDVVKKIVKFKKNGEILGMILLNLDRVSSQLKCVCNNVCYSDKRVLMPMFAFLSTLSLQIDEIQLYLPSDLEIWPYLTDRPQNIEVKERSMIRIVDVMKLNGLKLKASNIEFSVDITDKAAQWNNGVFKFKVEEGIMSVKRTEDADIACDISVLSSVISGYTDFQTMYDGQRVGIKKGHALNFDLPRETTFLGYNF